MCAMFMKREREKRGGSRDMCEHCATSAYAGGRTSTPQEANDTSRVVMRTS